MSAFAAFLSEKVDRYIELRRSLGYAFDKQAGTLRAFVQHVELSRQGRAGPGPGIRKVPLPVSATGLRLYAADGAAPDSDLSPRTSTPQHRPDEW